MTPRPLNGWHWREWGSEFAGTGLLMFAVVSAWTWCVALGPPWATFAVRVPILSAVAGAVVIAVAYSPLGRRSGAHLNPAVTVGLWLQRAASASDLSGYVVAQFAGGTAGFALGWIWGARVAEDGVRFAQIAPNPQLNPMVPLLLEASVTAVQLVIVFVMLQHSHLTKWAAVAAGVLLAISITAFAGITGAGFNPVRGLGPDIVSQSFPGAWIYLVGPLTGAGLAAALVSRGLAVKTAKLSHDSRIPCHLRCDLPHAAAPQEAVPAA